MKFLARLFGGRRSTAQNAITSRDLALVLGGGAAGYVSPRDALRTACVLRCVDLLSASLAMLPMRVVDRTTRVEATDHPLNRRLTLEPNNWQTAFEFRRLMELRRLCFGNAYALVVRGVGDRILALQPLDDGRVTVEQTSDWSLTYHITKPDGSVEKASGRDVLHLRDLSVDGVLGDARTRLASEAIRIARAAESAQARMFANGMMVGGALSHPGTLSDEAHKRLREAMEARYSGPENAGKWMILEEGMKAERFSMTAQEAQTIEARNHQIEDVARAFGVPRPLLMMNDTSWGSGIEQLAILFVRFGLAPGMVAWEQACQRVLLSERDKERYEIEIDERELLRGSMKDQGEFFAKALGSGGHAPFMEQNEVRQVLGLGPHPDGHGLKQAVRGAKNATSGQDQADA
ncbi:phage portal protein [Pedomonas sp. V897]|uniref:phage portal protein n=1 Tax=Pedomonas sp. V897 TaxID=3446482 RepID=UPI003EDEB2A5